MQGSLVRLVARPLVRRVQVLPVRSFASPAAATSLNVPSTSSSSSSSSTSSTTPSSSTPEFGIYPGNKRLPYTSVMSTHPPADIEAIPCFRIMDEDGNIRPDAVDPNVGEEVAVKAYKGMVKVAVMDGVLYESQRQGRISFYMTSWGEEATHIGSIMAINPDDEIFAQYREVGTLLWRGFTIQEVCDQCFGNVDDIGKGRQMPVHYGSAKHHFQTISSPLCTQLPQAAGAAYFCKLEGKGRVTVCYFGEGAASEGDFHAALNMATTSAAPCIFFCRNNGYAISTPVASQYRGDGIAARGIAYGMHTIRVDGNDIWAVLEATKAARKIATGEDGTGVTKPVLIEAMTYRESHHSTSDDSTRYRSTEEISDWRSRSNPIKRLRAYLEKRGWWDAQKEAALQAEERKIVLTALATSEQKPRPPISSMFEDVYGDKKLPQHLADQAAELQAHMAEHPGEYAAEGH